MSMDEKSSIEMGLWTRLCVRYGGTGGSSIGEKGADAGTVSGMCGVTRYSRAAVIRSRLRVAQLRGLVEVLSHVKYDIDTIPDSSASHPPSTIPVF